MIIVVALTIFSGCHAGRYAVAGSDTKGLPFGTILTIGGQKMIVVSQATQEVKLKPYSSVAVKPKKLVTNLSATPSVSMTGVKTEEPKGNIVKPEWDSKKVVTEGVKTVQECHDPRGCPQDVATGECLEGCSEQKVKVEMTETIVTPEMKVEVTKPVSDTLDPKLVLDVLFRYEATTSTPKLKSSFKKYYGKPEWLCVMINYTGTRRTKVLLTKLLYSNPKFVQMCNTAFPSNANQWDELPKSKYYN
tara:strand:+ start:2032 stop:2772 length:741 start_codon:yes stop_codon:yes gene_type:complete